MREVKGLLKRGVGFTLIELLIVVAIIAILAAIAVPNFLLAQTRAKISRVDSDLRTIGMALETYKLDNGLYVPHDDVDIVRSYIPLTTPVAYMTSIPLCPFASALNAQEGLYGRSYHMETDVKLLSVGNGWPSDPGRTIAYTLYNAGRGYLLWSIGPDLKHNLLSDGLYDATNGVKSLGDIMYPKL
jgi:type II secretion system protein G